MRSSEVLRNCLASTANVSGCGRSLAQRRSPATIGIKVTGWHSLEQLLRKLRRRAKTLHSSEPREPTLGLSSTLTLRGLRKDCPSFTNDLHTMQPRLALHSISGMLGTISGYKPPRV